MTENLAEFGIVLFAEIEALETEPPLRICDVRLQNTIGIEAVHVIELPLAGIAEDVVRLGDPLENFFRLPVTRIDVRVITAGEFAERSFDVVHRRSSSDLENDVEIVFTGHSSSLFLLI